MTTELHTDAVADVITMPKGFRASGTCAGIKKNSTKDDMALFESASPATVAGTFTMNQVKAASVKLCQARIEGGSARAIVVNSGNANACTGAQGLTNAKKMSTCTSSLLGVLDEEVFVCSTGTIGVQLPMDKVESGISELVEKLASDGGEKAAIAIMTTDTKPKYCSAEIQVNGEVVTICGIAKGSGMIHPNMATMLAFVLTDAKVEKSALQGATQKAVSKSFNAISVDGDTSTNDTCLVLANGEAGNDELDTNHPDWQVFVDALEQVCLSLALKMVEDGEGATKVVTVNVVGAKTEKDADTAARTVANSIEVRASWHSSRAGWGRIMHALGYSKAEVVEEKVDIDYDGVMTTKAGVSADPSYDQLRDIVSKKTFTININLNLGDAKAVVYSCDCTEEYVRLNTY